MLFIKKRELEKAAEEKELELKQREWKEKHLEIFEENLIKHYKAQKEIIKYLEDIGCFRNDYIEVTTVAEVINRVLHEKWVIEGRYEYALQHWESLFVKKSLISYQQEEIHVINSEMKCLESLIGKQLPITYRIPADWYEVKSFVFKVKEETKEECKDYHVSHIYYHKPTGIIVKCLFIPKNKNEG